MIKTFRSVPYAEKIMLTAFGDHHESVFRDFFMQQADALNFDIYRSILLNLQAAFSLSNTSLVSQITRSLSNRACLGYDGKVGHWIPRGISFLRPLLFFLSSLLTVVSLSRLPRNRPIRVSFTHYPRSAFSARWRSLGITSLRNMGRI
ncbi:hypothetical protein TNCV_3062131 [Trichonephila clavipes]|nr:hypothetical protein TNCV_3062131 [Trichonephila clavipes]